MCVGMYRCVLHSWHWELHGYSSVHGFGQVVSSYAGSCFLYFMKVMALFSNSPPNDNSVQKTVSSIYVRRSLTIFRLFTALFRLSFRPSLHSKNY